jgi:hypothetical protein
MNHQQWRPVIVSGTEGRRSLAAGVSVYVRTTVDGKPTFAVCRMTEPGFPVPCRSIVTGMRSDCMNIPYWRVREEITLRCRALRLLWKWTLHGISCAPDYCPECGSETGSFEDQPGRTWESNDAFLHDTLALCGDVVADDPTREPRIKARTTSMYCYVEGVAGSRGMFAKRGAWDEHTVPLTPRQARRFMLKTGVRPETTQPHLAVTEAMDGETPIYHLVWY